MAYSVVDVEEVPYIRGTFKFVRHDIGATAFGFTQIDLPADTVGLSFLVIGGIPGGGYEPWPLPEE